MPEFDASIILLTYNNLEYTRQCLQSLYEKTDLDFELVVVDNNSQDDTPEFLDEFANAHPNVHLILNKENYGFARGNNMGAEIAQGRYFVFLNNDTIVTQGWLAGLIRHLQDPQVGMVGPVTNNSGNETRIVVNYTEIDQLETFAKTYTGAHRGESFEISMLPFLCVVLRRKVFEEIGPLDDRFGVGMFEDDDYAERLHAAGYRILCAEDVFVHHWGSVSFSRLGETRFRTLFEENRRKFEEKWGFEWQPHLYRPELLRQQVKEMVDGAAWLSTQIDDFKRQVSERDQRIAYLENTLGEIYKSNAWTFVKKIWSIRLGITPVGSTRERIYLWFWKRFLAIARFIRHHPLRMNWYAYAFDRFKRARHVFAVPDLSEVRLPVMPGMVSIVLPVYNGADFIQESLDSILNQTYQDFEIIIVDDGSTDDTPQILEEYRKRDSRIKVIQQSNQRLPRALSNGFKHASGEYYTWTSADNRMKPDFLQRLVTCLERHPKWDMIYANQDIIEENGRPMLASTWFEDYQTPPGSEHIMLPTDPSVLNTWANNYIGAAFLYRSRVDALVGDYSPWRFGTEDYDYWMRVNGLLNLRHADFKDPVYDYRFHATSLTSRDDELGITRNRVKLMTFEDFRRDFFLSPIAWKIEASNDDAASVLEKQVRSWITANSQYIIDDYTCYPAETPRLWFPDVYLKISNTSPELVVVPEDCSSNALKVLVLCGQVELPVEMDPSWDMCIVIGTDRVLPRLGKPRQGWWSVPNYQLLCTIIDIRARSKSTAALEMEIESTEQPPVKISVVICTYQRGDLLMKSMRSVAQQDFPPEEYELVVVSNDPNDESVDRIVADLHRSDFQNRIDHLRLVKCPFKGLSFARNAGISESRGEVVCFLDDDAIAHSDWLTQVWIAFEQNPNAGVVGGKIMLEVPEEARGLVEGGWGKFWSEFLPTQTEISTVARWWEFPWGVNWSARKKALLLVGGFRGIYGRKGTDFGGGEELVAALLIHRLNYEVVINPSATVLHIPEIKRFTVKHVWRTILAGKANEYRQQVDLYLPMTLRIWRFIFYIGRSLSLALIDSGKHRRIEHLIYAWAEARLIERYLQDWISRFRRPFTIQ